MGVTGAPVLRPALLPLADLELSAEQAALLRRRAAGKTEPTLVDLDRWLRARDLSPAERDLFTDIRDAMVGGLRGANLLRLSGEGMRRVQRGDAANFFMGADVVGDRPELVKLRADLLRDGLIGQAGALPGFMALAKDFYSPARETPPTMAISGHRGHGKNEAVNAFSASLFGADAPPPLKVDLSEKLDRDESILFEGEDAPLSIEALQALLESGGVVHLTGIDNLATRAPKLAARLATRLSSREGDPEHARVPYVLDFSVEGPPELLTAAALGAVGIESLAGTSRFVHLSQAAVWHYAEQRLATKLKRPGLSNVIPEVEPEAQEFLAQLLTTPYAPLDSMEERLTRFLLTLFDTQTSVDRSDSVLGISFSTAYRDDRAKRDALVAAMHLPEPNLLLGVEAFRAQLTGKTQHLSPAEISAASNELASAFSEIRPKLPLLFRDPGDDLDEARLDVLLAQLTAAEAAVAMAQQQLNDAVFFNALVPLRPGVHKVVTSALKALAATIDEATGAVAGANDDEALGIASVGSSARAAVDALLELVNRLATAPEPAAAQTEATEAGATS
jgi:hypothetical protein